MLRGKEHHGVRLGSVAGIDLVVDWSLFLILWLLTSGLAFGALPRWHPEWSALVLGTVAVTASVLFLASILGHELAHALVGKRYGVVVRRITLFLFGGVAHVQNEPKSPRAELAMAIAGPATSLLIGLLATVLGLALAVDSLASSTTSTISALGIVPTVLLWLGPINIVLALFNLLPGFPLDGGRVLRALLWSITGDLQKATRWSSGVGQGIAWILMGAGLLMAFGLRMPFFGVGLVPGLWLLLIGWFLNTAARTSYQQLVLQELLQGVPVTAVMRTNLLAVEPDTSISTFVRDYAMNSDQLAFPVVNDRQLVGLVRVTDVRKAPYHRWSNVGIEHIATPIEDDSRIDAERTASDALDQLNRNDTDYLVVMRGGIPHGFVGERDIMKWIELRSGLWTAASLEGPGAAPHRGARA